MMIYPQVSYGEIARPPQPHCCLYASSPRHSQPATHARPQLLCDDKGIEKPQTQASLTSLVFRRAVIHELADPTSLLRLPVPQLQAPPTNRQRTMDQSPTSQRYTQCRKDLSRRPAVGSWPQPARPAQPRSVPPTDCSSSASMRLRIAATSSSVSVRSGERNSSRTASDFFPSPTCLPR